MIANSGLYMTLGGLDFYLPKQLQNMQHHAAAAENGSRTRPKVRAVFVSTELDISGTFVSSLQESCFLETEISRSQHCWLNALRKTNRTPWNITQMKTYIAILIAIFTMASAYADVIVRPF
jgi:hypothetical protein